MSAYQNVCNPHIKVSRTVKRSDSFSTGEAADNSHPARNANTPLNQNCGFSGARNPEIEALFDRLLQKADYEIWNCYRSGKPIVSLLRTPQRNRNKFPKRGVERRGTPSGVHWLRTPHMVTLRNGVCSPVTTFDDAPLRLAYETAQWKKRAERFNILLDTRDTQVQLKEFMQDFPKPGVHTESN
ncbi:uncharacterized protein LOC135387269 [Ornithodoros turicata]|uniref:uncharacterized protein LOC135387269 n=1 Tax=Ornithodoros turicata TaxID=34597 RepID=UPI003138E062